MSVNQTQSDILKLKKQRSTSSAVGWRRIARAAVIARIALIALVLFLAGGGTITAQEFRKRTYSMATAGWGFDLLEWEAGAVTDKIRAQLTRPSAGMTPELASRAVVDYMARADRIGQIEDEITRLLSEGKGQGDPVVVALQSELAAMRTEQSESRHQVEQIIERQVSYALDQAGFSLLGNPFPPVQFTFTEPPKKLIVSPRDRIATAHSRMLSPGMPLSDIEEAEADINEGERAKAYITNIGGLGAFPTMVIDRASLGWVLNTVAHEWTHNYLALYPLGWSYFRSQDMTTLNETVAEIVGDEVGEAVFDWFYAPLDARPAQQGDGVADEVATPAARIPLWESTMEAEAAFDFRKEMRETRMEVDRLLAAGRVEDAEQYMEERRLMFVANGIPLRVLNQAYFAFHGSYGTSPASTSPIGPKLRELRALAPDLAAFVDVVKHFNDVADLDAALDEWTLRHNLRQN